ncbi:terminase small subunit [Salinicoccus albus]|uniref:terminase small subunit n=1 Tax=Salinicoccus albus TaxID=418756 RepID=UPI0003767E6D|nr:terminase small subunit [Salinicoccus albus]
MDNLTDRQKKFAWEYWQSGNRTKAAAAAGYSKKTAHSQGSRLLKNVEIQELVKEFKEESEASLRQQFSRDAVEARKIMFNIMENDEAPEHVRLSAAKDFMDRAGFKPIDKQETELNGQLDMNVKSDVINKYLRGDKDDR